MSTAQILDFTVADLLAGGDDIVLLATGTDDPDGLWNETVYWPRPRLTAALVAAVGIIQGDDEPATAANGHFGHVAADNDRMAGQVATRPSVDGH